MVLLPPGNSQNRRGNVWTSEEVGPSKIKTKTKEKPGDVKEDWRGWHRFMTDWNILVKMVWWCKSTLPLSSVCLHHLLCTPVSSFTQDTESFCMCMYQTEPVFHPRAPAALFGVPFALYFPDVQGRKEHGTWFSKAACEPRSHPPPLWRPWGGLDSVCILSTSQQSWFLSWNMYLAKYPIHSPIWVLGPSLKWT